MANKKEENPLIIKLNKAIKFEEKEVKEIDLSGLENLKTKDLIEVEKQYNLDGNLAAQPESTFAYARLIAERVTDLPLEFYDSLNGKQMIKLRNAVMGFFYEEE